MTHREFCPLDKLQNTGHCKNSSLYSMSLLSPNMSTSNKTNSVHYILYSMSLLSPNMSTSNKTNSVHYIT